MYVINTEDYFKNERYIAGLNEPKSDARRRLEALIDVEVRSYLLENLGKVEFDALNGFILPDGTLNPSAPQKWKDLVNGKTYSDGMYWKGLIEVYGSVKDSYLADLIFSKFIEQNQSKQAGVGGEQITMAKNSVLVDVLPKVVNYFNKFVLAHQGDFCTSGYLGQPRRAIINGIEFTDYYTGGTQSIDKMSFVDYLQKEFPDFQFVIVRIVKCFSSFLVLVFERKPEQQDLCDDEYYPGNGNCDIQHRINLLSMI